MVAKVEHLPGRENPRFIVTSVPLEECDGRRLYEQVYCARGDMENRIKEQQLGLFADRTSSKLIAANQLRLYFSAFAYLMVHTLRWVGLAGTKLARAQSWTLRLKLLKIGAQVPGHHPQGLVVLFRGLPVCGVVEDGPDPTASDPASVLATQGSEPSETGK